MLQFIDKFSQCVHRDPDCDFVAQCIGSTAGERSGDHVPVPNSCTKRKMAGQNLKVGCIIYFV